MSTTMSQTLERAFCQGDLAITSTQEAIDSRSRYEYNFVDTTQQRCPVRRKWSLRAAIPIGSWELSSGTLCSGVTRIGWHWRRWGQVRNCSRSVPPYRQKVSLKPANMTARVSGAKAEFGGLEAQTMFGKPVALEMKVGQSFCPAIQHD